MSQFAQFSRVKSKVLWIFNWCKTFDKFHVWLWWETISSKLSFTLSSIPMMIQWWYNNKTRNQCNVTDYNHGQLKSSTLMQFVCLWLLTVRFATIIFASAMPFDGTFLTMPWALHNIVICQIIAWVSVVQFNLLKTQYEFKKHWFVGWAYFNYKNSRL